MIGLTVFAIAQKPLSRAATPSPRHYARPVCAQWKNSPKSLVGARLNEPRPPRESMWSEHIFRAVTCVDCNVRPLASCSSQVYCCPRCPPLCKCSRDFWRVRRALISQTLENPRSSKLVAFRLSGLFFPSMRILSLGTTTAALTSLIRFICRPAT